MILGLMPPFGLTTASERETSPHWTEALLDWHKLDKTQSSVEFGQSVKPRGRVLWIWVALGLLEAQVGGRLGEGSGWSGGC